MKKIILFSLIFFSFISFSNACHDWWDYAWDSSYNYDSTVSVPLWNSNNLWITAGDLWPSQVNILPSTPTIPTLPAWSDNDEQFKAIQKVISEASWWWSQFDAIKKVIDEAWWNTSTTTATKKTRSLNPLAVDPAELKKACEGNDPTVASFRKLAKQYNLVDPCNNIQ